MMHLLRRFFGHVVRLTALFALVTCGVYRIFFSSLQPKSPLLAIIGETATPDQLQILHRQIDPAPHTFFAGYLHWVSGLYPSVTVVGITVLAVVAVFSKAYRRTPHDTDPKASVALLLTGTYV